MVRDNQRCRYYPDCEVHVPWYWWPKEKSAAPKIPQQRKPREKSQASLRLEAMIPVMRQLLEDGYSYNEVARRLGIHPSSVKSRCPGMSQWTKSDGGKLGMANRWTSVRVSRKSGIKGWKPLDMMFHKKKDGAG